MQLMRKFIISSVVAIFVSLSGMVLGGCQQQFTEAQSVSTPAPSYILNANHSPMTEGKEAPDDIIFTPGGLGYIANLHRESEVSVWSPIVVSEADLGNKVDAIHVNYRAYVETKAGEMINNIIVVNRHGLIPLPLINMDIKDINLKVAGLSENIRVWQDLEWHGPPGLGKKVLFMEIPEVVKSGEYSFEIGVEVNGKDFGRVPCTIKVE